jgi:hypothetical protein
VKPYLRHLLSAIEDPLQGRSVVREYLQARVLQSLQEAGVMVPLAFHGGTALRFLYNIPRYSEDLDFALERQPELYDFQGYLQVIERDFAAEGYAVTVRYNDQKVVHSAFVRFPGLLHELALSPHADEIVAIKLEVDTRPPAGATLATTVVKRHVLLNLQHHDPATLLAGKLHALLQRPFTKGRDWYDLAWYLDQPAWPAPNLVMLNHALAQTEWTGPVVTPENWCDLVQERLTAIDWDRAVRDVAPFILDESRDLLQQEQILAQLSSRCADEP